MIDVNPLTVRGRLWQLLGFVACPLLPLFTLVIYSSVLIARHLDDSSTWIVDRDVIMSRTQLVPLVTALELERATRVIVEAINGSNTNVILVAHDTDIIVKEIEAWPGKYEIIFEYFRLEFALSRTCCLRCSVPGSS